MNQNIYDKLKQILSSAQVKADEPDEESYYVPGRWPGRRIRGTEDKGRTFTGYYML